MLLGWSDPCDARKPWWSASDLQENEMSELEPRIRAELLSAAVPTVVSLLYKRGYDTAFMPAPKALNPAANTFVGVAFTVRTVPVRKDLVEDQAAGRRPALQGQATNQVGKGDVLVVGMDGETRTAFMGDIMATHFLTKGVAGVVLDGGVSDAAAISKIPLPVFACGTAGYPVTSHRFVLDLQVPIACGGVTVFPGDVIMGDGNGVVVIPRALAPEIAKAAADREKLESWIVAEVAKGRSLAGFYPPTEATMAEYAKVSGA
jgi:regulator of RNase E activity RraA